MKNIFAVNITNEENSKLDGEEFVIKKIDEDLQKRFDQSLIKSQQYEKKASLPSWLNLIKHVVCGLAIITSIALISSIAENGQEALDNASNIFTICIVGWIIFLALHIFEKQRKKNVEKDDGFKKTSEEDMKLLQECLTQLDVPSNYMKIDCFSEIYKEKNGEVKNAFPIARFINFNYFTYADKDNVYFCDQTSVISIEKRKISKLLKFENKVAFYGWNKEDLPNREPYKSFKITISNIGQIYVKTYYGLVFEHDYNEYIIYFPPYELENISKLIELDTIEKQIISK